MYKSWFLSLQVIFLSITPFACYHELMKKITVPQHSCNPAVYKHGSARAAEYGELQKLVDALYAHKPSGSVTKIDVEMRAEIDDLSDDLCEVIKLLPGGSYKRSVLCDHLNSIITAHGWGYVYGCVE
ncbi:hypothetical protein HMPREF3232_01192 [Fannyhessea vaginae]|nr:hypothetical protein HMPREF3232_01192 [Fannyhessea vaginae]